MTYLQLYSPSAKRTLVLGPFDSDEAAQAWLRAVMANPGPRLQGRTVKPLDWEGSIYEPD